MLTIPEEIKELLHRDHWYKNIRIHFPNGERSDICNDLIVKDSVSFTESVCSQNDFKFGLCESPVFECETVGVGNIKGATIEVYCEIGCTPSVSGVEWRADLQRYVYPIPYGVFVVQESGRQADMIHRKIRAYSTLMNENETNNHLEDCKMNYSRNYATSYSPNAFLLAMINAKTVAFSENVFNHSRYYPILSNNYLTFSWIRYGSESLSCKVFLEDNYSRFSYGNYDLAHATIDDIYRVNFQNKESVADNIEQIIYELVDRYGWADLPGNSARVTSKELLELTFTYYSSLRSAYYNYNSLDVRGKSSFVFYPWLSNESRISSVFLYTRVNKIQVIKDSTSEVLEEVVLSNQEGTFRDEISLDYYTAIDTSLNEYIMPYEVVTNNYGFNTYVRPEISNQQILNDLLALSGCFGLITRAGTFEMFNIKQRFGLNPENDLYPDEDLYPAGVTGGKLLPQDYQSCWYDDYYTLPFGAVQCQYKDGNNDECILTYYLQGYDEETDINTYRIYKVDNNYYIQNNVWTEAEIQEICERIADNIEGVRYMPVEFVGRGLPYVEAGDTFEILTKTNDSITTIVLNRTLTGELTLTDNYKSV